METDLVAKALRIMALEYMGLADDSSFPPPKTVQGVQEDEERMICSDFGNAYPDLKELFDLSTQLSGYAATNKWNLTIGKYESIERMAEGIKDIFWAGVGLVFPKEEYMQLAMVNDKVALVEGKASPKKVLVAAMLDRLKGHEIEVL